jgi:uncharacterized protein
MRKAHRLIRAEIPAFAGMTGLLTLLIALVAVPSAAQTFPQLTGRVVDDAHILSPATVADLTSKSAALEKRTFDQLVIVTIRSLGGRNIKSFATQLANHWGVGQKKLDNGVLVVVAPNEHLTRIAVGYGLEGLLTDARSAVIVHHIVPCFSKGNYDAGLELGEREIIARLLSDTHRPRRKQS